MFESSRPSASVSADRELRMELETPIATTMATAVPPAIVGSDAAPLHDDHLHPDLRQDGAYAEQWDSISDFQLLRARALDLFRYCRVTGQQLYLRQCFASHKNLLSPIALARWHGFSGFARLRYRVGPAGGNDVLLSRKTKLACASEPAGGFAHGFDHDGC